MVKQAISILVMVVLVTMLIGCSRAPSQPTSTVAQPVEKSETDFEKFKNWHEKQESVRQKQAAKELQEKQRILDDLKKREDEFVDKVIKKIVAPLQAEREADKKAKKEAEEAKMMLEKIVGPIMEQLKALQQRMDALEKSKAKPKEKLMAPPLHINPWTEQLVAMIVRSEIWHEILEVKLDHAKKVTKELKKRAKDNAESFQRDVDRENAVRRAKDQKPLDSWSLEAIKAADGWAVINAQQREWQIQKEQAAKARPKNWAELQLEYQRRYLERMRTMQAAQQPSKYP